MYKWDDDHYWHSTVSICDRWVILLLFHWLLYTYDNKDRLQKVTLLKNDNPIFFEEYTYNDQGLPIEVYIFNSGLYTVNIAPYSKQKLDQQGNTIEEIGLTPKGEVTKTRYYEYTYDQQGNWIQCKLFLDGKTPKPTVIAKRIITYYNE